MRSAIRSWAAVRTDVPRLFAATARYGAISAETVAKSDMRSPDVWVMGGAISQHPYRKGVLPMCGLIHTHANGRFRDRGSGGIRVDFGRVLGVGGPGGAGERLGWILD
ncbi:hypothetical protein GCM10010211_36180 [Streptomyces albospinus]|uniref:Uncharacterized protein n=1 Tax=Streptomyces albospinus TaxID=285515 RepID=A0ABQ2V5T9_9ACTN|nr:hypothetical protein GCM10010211_36180 [Streptomyces albospinus]